VMLDFLYSFSEVTRLSGWARNRCMSAMPARRLVEGSGMLGPDHKLWKDSQCGPMVRFQSRYCIILASSIIMAPIHHEHASVSSTSQTLLCSGA
jgi:hypothetical protein